MYHKNIAKHSTVLILSIVALLLLFVYALLAMTKDVKDRLLSSDKQYSTATSRQVPNTAGWREYVHSNPTISFLVPPMWSNTTKTVEQMEVITFTAPEGSADQRVRVYITKDAFVGFEGLPQKNSNLGGNKVVQVDEGLAGISNNGVYYTFEAGPNSSSQNTLQSILGTVSFPK